MRDDQIIAMYRWGKSMKHIASKTGLEWRQIYYVLSKRGVKLRGWREKAA